MNVTYRQFAGDQTNAIDGAGSPFFVDAGTSANFDATSTRSDAQERWVADDTTGDGVPDPPTRPITLKDTQVIAVFFHQVRPRVLLSGTNSSSTVSCSKRKLFGRDNLPANLFGTFQEFSDVRSQLAFSATSSGSPILAAEGVREFTVQKGLNVTVQYVVQPRQDLSTLVASVTRLPADGSTPVAITVTIRDSAGNPVGGIDPTRVQVYPSDTDGVRVTAPTVPTDTTGRLVFVATRNIPGSIDFTGTLDGQSIASQVSVEFLQIMRVPLPVSGLYMVSFPITPEDSHAAFLNMDVTPKPPQVARLTDGTATYVYFQANQPNAALNIAPGRGFFVNTQTPGSAQLTGQWSTGPTFNFQMSPVGFHQVGNPQTDHTMLWRLADFEVFQGGIGQGLLNTAAAQVLVDPVGWAFNGQGYEMVADPIMPGTEGLRSEIGVFEGFFWHASQDGVGVVYTPNSGRGRAALPISPSNCGFSIAATVGERTSTVVLGARPLATRAAAAPPSPTGPEAVSLAVVTPEGGRAAADWVGQPISQPVTWTLAATTAQPGQSVTLSWARLGRQLPAGYQVRLRDLQSGRATLLNTHSSYAFRSGAVGSEQRFEVTVVPRAGHGLQVLGFQPAAGRARAMSFAVQLSGEAEVSLPVSSLTGRPVAQTRPVTATGSTTLAWNGLDSAGRKVPAGVYQVTLLARNAAGESVRVVRVVTLR
ncbi:MAG: hypothetical protein HYU66_14850 [Armatimonadetes bacterium]|nr:hypothetical protein [Armatimonadota bacterium]